MSKTPKQAITADRPTSRQPYEAPRLEVVELRPEEQLLGCMKSGSMQIVCIKHPLVS